MQGYKPINSDIAREKAKVLLQELGRFSGLSRKEADDLTRTCKLRAEQVMRELKKNVEQASND